MQLTTKLKTILQFKKFYFFLCILTIIYIIVTTKIIKYDTNLKNFSSIEGIVTNVSYKDYGIKFTLNSSEKIECNYYTVDKIDLLGKKIRVEGKATKTYNNTIPNTFNYKNYLYNNKIYLTYEVNKLEILKEENVFYHLKNKINDRIDNFNDIIKPYIKLFITGNKDDLNDNLYNIYKTNGIWHLFAISGMHVGFIISFFDFFLKKFRFKKVITSFFLGFFTFLTNYSASVLRVVLFYFLKTIFSYFNINITNENILILCASLILIVNPFMIYNVGFQYSFLISFALIMASNKITGNYLVKILKISLIALLVSLPITINLNYEINLLSILLNIIFVPFISLILFPCSIITFIFSFLSPFYSILINLLELSNTYFYNLKLNIIIPQFSMVVIILYYFSIYLIYRFKAKKYYILLVLILIINYLIPKFDSNYYVYFLDVGQGDSSILISPYKREVLMIDTGGNDYNDYHVSDNVILFLKSLGIKKIDLLILSHGDADHAKETLNLLDKYTIKNIILNNNSYNELEKEIILKGHVVNNYQSTYFNFINLKDYGFSDENSSSIITYFNILNYKLLYLGDTTKEVEQQLIKTYNIKTDIVKIAHHGSNTSSDYNFLKEINPSLAIISSGRENIYHHPSKETLNTLNNLNIKYLNTQTSGSIRLKINANEHSIKEYKP